MEWRDEYKRKLMSVEEAVRIVKSGDRVVIPLGTAPRILPPALAARKEELKNVTIITCSPGSNPGWLNPGWQDSFKVDLELFIGSIARPAANARLTDYVPVLFSHQFKSFDERPAERKEIDVVMTVVSPPNAHGFCTFGGHMWNKRTYAKRAKKVVVEVDENQIRAHGNNYIHVSEIDAFVEHTPARITPEDLEKLVEPLQPLERNKIKDIFSYLDPEAWADSLPIFLPLNYKQLDELANTFGLCQPDDVVRQIGEHLSKLVQDGDTLQIGVGGTTGHMPMMGIFDNKIDLGVHTEMGARGIGRLVQNGVINGKRKTLHQGKAIASTWSGCDAEDFKIIDDNPLFELHDSQYVVNVRTVSSIDNMCAMNNAIAVDLTGQINSETIFGPNMFNGTGGQPEMVLGSVLSKGGKSIHLLPSTAQGGAVSRITPMLDSGAVVTIPRTFADYIVTEYGVAKLLGKSSRERAEELISVAHPDFRAELRKEAQKLFYPG